MIKDRAFLNIIRSTPLVSVDLIIGNSTGEVLLGQRLNAPCRGFWFVPGGIVRKNERIKGAIQRVSKNELGLSLDSHDMRFLGVFEHLYPDNFLGEDGVDTHYVVLAYETQVHDDVSLVLDEQHSEAKWWRVGELLQDPGVHENTKSYFRNDEVYCDSIKN